METRPTAHIGWLRLGGELLVALGAVSTFTILILVLSGAPPFAAIAQIIKGSLGSWSKFAHVVKAWIPLTLCGMGLLYTFRIGLWNIGIEGQVIAGAILTTAIVKLGLDSGNPQLFLALAIGFGAVGGAIWAILAGWLKTKGGVHEIFAGLGLNFVAQGIALWLIFGPWKRPGVASMSGTEVFPPEFWLPYLAHGRICLPGLALAFFAIVFTAVTLRYARFGLNLKAIGSNRVAAYLFGLKPDRCMLLAMVFAGAFAGIAGSLQVTAVYHRLIPAISSNYGYLALLVVMLSNYNIAAVPAVAFFFACLNVGSIQLPMVLKIDSSLSGVIQGALVLATLAMQAWRARRKRERETV
ncbi:MAG: ABC transporter, permease protein 1 (cluster 11, riboflavin/purine nucleoside/unknown) [Olavius algarvensis Delta 4 endosymbiont]|nr:MAG: ABC transporter, permease protein 1 (cluster 11, riboflavin/purine nucleoside/unknown) [Olavius algarvensis Delta 4 endosymbiont]